MACTDKEKYEGILKALEALPANLSLAKRAKDYLNSLPDRAVVASKNFAKSSAEFLRTAQGKNITDITSEVDSKLKSLVFNEEVFFNRESLRNALDEVGVTPATRNNLISLFFGDQKTKDPGYLNTFNKVWKRDWKAIEYALNAQERPINWLAVNDNGQPVIPNNIIFANMIHAYDWYSSAEKNPFADTSYLADFLYGDRQTSVTANDITLGQEKLNYSRLNVLQDIGRATIRTLNIGPVSTQKEENKDLEEASKYLLEGISDALGLMAVATMSEPSLNLVSIRENNKVTIPDYDDASYAQPETFDYPLITKNEDAFEKVGNPRTRIQNKFVQVTAELPKILGLEFNTDSLNTRPIKRVQSSIRGSTQRVPKDTQGIMKRLQAVPWTRNAAADVFDILLADPSSDGYKLLLELEGYDDIDADMPQPKKGKDIIPDETRLRINAKNEHVRRNLEYIRAFNSAGKLGKFYLQYRSMIQGRLMQSGPINPQNSKAHRHYFTTMVNGREDGLQDITEQNIGMWKFAVVQWLEPNGLAPDKAVDGPEIWTAFDNLYKDANIQAALDALDNVKEDSDAFVQAVNNLLAGTSGMSFSGNWSVIDALVALKAYRDADDGNKTFQSSLMYEADGITNGFAISTIQTGRISADNPGEFEKHLNQTGTYTQYEQEHVEGLGKPKEDIYTEIGMAFVKTLQSFREDPVTAALNDVLFESDIAAGKDPLKVARNLAKQPFMIFNYGAGNKKLAVEVREEVRNALYDNALKLQRDFNNAQTDAEKAKIIEKASKLKRNYITLYKTTLSLDPNEILKFEAKEAANGRSAKQLLEKNKFVLYINPAKGEKSKRFNRVFYNASKENPTPLQQAFEASISAELETYTKVRQNLIKALSIQNAAFAYVFERKVEELKLKLDIDKLTDAQIKDLINTDPDLVRLHPKLENSNTEPGRYLELLNIIRADTDQRSVYVDVAPDVLPAYDENGNPTGKSKSSLSSNPSTITIGQMGMHAFVRAIQNIDSQIMNEVLRKHPRVLNIYDAVLMRPGDANAVVKTYNDAYLDKSLDENGIVKQIANQLEDTLEFLKEQNISEQEIKKHHHKVLKDSFALTNAKKKETFGSILAQVKEDQRQNERVRNRLNDLRDDFELVDENNQPTGKTESSLHSQQMFTHNGNQSAHKEWRQTVDPVYRERTGLHNEVIKLFAGNPSVPEIIAMHQKIAKADGQKGYKSKAQEWWRSVEAANLKDKKLAARNSLLDLINFNTASTEILNSLDPGGDIETSTDYSRRDIAKELKQIFDDMARRSDGMFATQEQQDNYLNHLQGLLETMVDPVVRLNKTSIDVNWADTFTFGSFDVVNQHITVNVNTNVPITYAEQSPAEVFMHESLHAVARHVIANNPDIRKKLERLHLQMRRAVDYKIFLRKDAQGNVIVRTNMAEEVAHAKKMYSYIFDARKDKGQQLEEFFVYGLTNPGLIEASENTVVESTGPKRNALLQLVDIFKGMFEWLLGKINKDMTDKNVQQMLVNIGRDMVAVQQKAKARDGIYKRTEKLAYDAMKKGSRAVSTRLQRYAEAAFQPISPESNQLTAAMKLTINAFALHYSELAKNQQRLAFAYNAVNNTLDGLVEELGEGALTPSLIKRLLVAKHQVDQNRETTYASVYEQLNEQFKSEIPLSNEDKKNITRAFLKTDISSLLGIGKSLAEIYDLLLDDVELHKLQVQLAKQVGIKVGTVADTAVNDLVKFMLTGKNESHNLRLNATALADLHLKTRSSKVVDALDALITVRALRATDINIRKNAHQIAKREMAIDSNMNGTNYVITFHAWMKEQALNKLFEGNPMLMQKGYIATVTGSMIETVNAPIADAARLKKEGFDLAFTHSELDNVPGSIKWGYYINRFSPNASRVTGMFSTVKNSSTGTRLTEILSRQSQFQKADGETDWKKVFNFVKQFTAKENQKMKAGQSGGAVMVPVINQANKIVDYRIHMSHSLMEQELEQDVTFDTVLSRQEGTAIAKYNTIYQNRKTADALKAHAETYRSEANKSIWVNLFDKSDPRMVNALQDLPSDTIEYTRTIADYEGKDPVFYVQASHLRAAFGYDNITVANNEFFKRIPGARKTLQVIEAAWQAVVGNAAARIVILMPQVVMDNLFSNLESMAIKGIPPTYLREKMQEATKELLQLKEDSRKARALQNVVNAYKLPDTAQEYQDLLMYRNRIANNKVVSYVNAGLYTQIAEDYDPTSDHGLEGAIARKWAESKLGQRTPRKVQDIAGQIYATQTSLPFRSLEQIVQLTDFASRYALIKYRTEEENVSGEAAFKEAMDTFVNYTEPMSKTLQYLNSMGAVMFVKFFMRANRVGFRTLKENPVQLAGAYGVSEATGFELTGVFGDTMYGGRFLPQILPIDNITGNAFDPFGISIAEDVGLLD